MATKRGTKKRTSRRRRRQTPPVAPPEPAPEPEPEAEAEGLQGGSLAAPAPPERPRRSQGDTLDTALRLLDATQLQAVQNFAKKARKGRLTAADAKAMEILKGQLQERRGQLEAEARLAGRRIVKGAGALGEAVGVSERTIFRWIRAGMPYTPASAGGEPSLFDLDQVEAWRIEERGADPTDDEEGNGADDDGVPTDAKSRLLHYNAEFRRVKSELATMELRVKRGQLVEAGEVERESVQKIVATKRALLGVPNKVAMGIVELLGAESSRVRDVAAVVRQELEDAITLHLAPRDVEVSLEPERPGPKDLPGQTLLFGEEGD